MKKILVITRASPNRSYTQNLVDCPFVMLLPYVSTSQFTVAIKGRNILFSDRMVGSKALMIS